MPPRWAVFAVVVFWLAATGWLIQRDMWPYWFPPPDDPPPFDVDMTDEFGSNHTGWHVFVNGEDVGTGSSEVKDMQDGTLLFITAVRFQKKALFDFCSSITSSNHITNKGELRKMSVSVRLKLFDEIGLEAVIDKGLLKPKVIFAGRTSMDLKPIEVPENGIVFNPAHLGTRIRRLRNGQTWRVPMLDIAATVKNSQGVFGTELWASVSQDVIQWAGEDVLCFKIEFTERGKGVVATSWVRQRDGQILKQQAKLLDALDLMLIRVHERTR